ncbi:MAG: glycosyltransferase family 39 protein [Anaerolineae bacterium]
MTKKVTASFKFTQATHWLLLAIMWVAFLLRTVNLSGQSLWRDEVDAINFSGWVVTRLISGLFKTGHNGPLFFLLLRFWRSFTGNSEFALRYPSALLGVLALPLGFVLARQLGLSRTGGLLLSVLLATSPYLVWYGQEAKMYTMLLALVLLAFIAYLRALSPSAHQHKGRTRRWWIIFVAATSLSFYTHILAPLMLPVYGLVALLNHQQLRQHWRGWLLSMSCLTVPYLPLVLWQAPLLSNGYQSGHPFYPLQKQFLILLQLYSQGLVSFAGVLPLILFVFLFLAGILLNQSSPAKTLPLPPTGRITLTLWALLPPLLIYLISLRIQVFEDRYLIYITPAFYLLVVVGLLLIRQYSAPVAALSLSLILLVNASGIWQQQRQPIKADFRAAGAYLASQNYTLTDYGADALLAIHL